jgi:2-oxoglutarate ferredoxin oxidoreductase subunit delta
MSKQTSAKGYHLPQITDDSHCLNCGLCMLLCPDFAIYVEECEVKSPTVAETTSNAEVKK